MATTSRNLSVTKSGYVKESNPSTVYRTNGNTNYLLTNDLNTSKKNRLYFGIEAWPSSLYHNLLYDLTFHFYLRPGQNDLSVIYCHNFDAASLTWNNQPTMGSEVATFTGAGSSAPGSWGNKSASLIAPLYITSVLGEQAFFLTDAALQVSDGKNWYAKTVLANNSAPYVTVNYDSTAKIISQAVWDTNGWFNVYNPRLSYTLHWHLTRASNQSGLCLYDNDDSWTQASAAFLYRIQGETNWTRIEITGSDMSFTLPPCTLPTGKTIEQCVEVTDTEGTVSRTEVKTATVLGTTLYVQNGPISGYKNPRNTILFSWYFGVSAGTVDIGSVSLYYKVAGDTDWTEVAAAAGADSLTMPANTFPIGTTVQWYLSGTDYSGSSSTTPTYTFSTAAGTTYATSQSPISSIEDGSAPITFQWLLTSTDGQAPTAVDLIWKLPTETDEQWHAILYQSSPVSSYTVPAGTFPAGEIQWTVRAYNIDGTAGPWSTPTSGNWSFICIKAPDPVEGLAATEVPRTTISWQSEEQQAFEISIDGKIVKKAYGPGTYSWQVSEPLSEGLHTISVRVQGAYELWSQPSTITISVDGPTSQDTLIGTFGVDAILLDRYATAVYTVRYYRDGVLIGTAPGGTEFVDRRVLGEHSYFSRKFIANGQYTQSNTITGTMQSGIKRIAALDDLQSDWLELKLSDKDTLEENYSWNKTASLQHVTGADFPVLESSRYQTRSGSFDAAFSNAEDVKRFEALHGRVVILKSRGENVIIGMLNALQKRVTRFYTAYTFSISQIKTEDFVEYENH